MGRKNRRYILFSENLYTLRLRHSYDMDPVTALCSNMGDFFSHMQQMMLDDNSLILSPGRRGPTLSPDFLEKMADIHSRLDATVIASGMPSELTALFRYMSTFCELSINQVVNADGMRYSTRDLSHSVYHEKRKKPVEYFLALENEPESEDEEADEPELRFLEYSHELMKNRQDIAHGLSMSHLYEIWQREFPQYSLIMQDLKHCVVEGRIELYELARLVTEGPVATIRLPKKAHPEVVLLDEKILHDADTCFVCAQYWGSAAQEGLHNRLAIFLNTT